ncbi:putative glycosyl transferase, group 1 family protein [Photobacterium gaetbulicola Gung47]|uniref:Putative glycosyl transferase, group 1 family protein n=2 Tax=Photobacterium gaetbulicola TaxID=1295392 RepID=A0A0C5X2E4_9GAMM|nr:putative glycosyl transferase, group 1 family protein [Photobacterium gaetbulicola Gung47]
MLTNVLPEKPGGRTKDIYKKAKLFSENGYKVKILSCSEMYQIENSLSNAISLSEHDPSNTVYQIYSDLRKEDSKKYRKNIKKFIPFFIKIKEEKSVTDGRVISNTFSNKYFTIKYDYCDEGRVIRKVVNKNNKKTTQVIFDKYYNKDGTVFLNKLCSVGEPLIIYNNGRYKSKRFKSVSQLKAFWLNEQFKGYSNIIASARKLDGIYLEAIKKDVNRERNYFFWYHSTHLDVSGIMRKEYDKSLHSHQENIKYLTLTNQQKNDIVTSYDISPDNILVLPFGKVGSIETNEDAMNVVSIVSRFSPEKNIDFAIRAFDRFYKTNDNFTLEIWGHGENERDYNKLIESLGAHDYIKIKGPTNKPLSVMAKSKVILSTSKIGGLENTIIEAISVGCPVAALPYRYGPKDIITPGISGYISDDFTEDGFVNVLTKCVKILDEYTREDVSNTLRSTDEKRKLEMKQWELNLK